MSANSKKERNSQEIRCHQWDNNMIQHMKITEILTGIMTMTTFLERVNNTTIVKDIKITTTNNSRTTTISIKSKLMKRLMGYGS